MEDNKDVLDGNKADVTAEKTYTEQELQQKTQESFNAGVKKASTDWQKDEKYKEFLNWKKSSQTDSDKLAELQKALNNSNQENNYLKAQVQVNSSNVKKEFSKFVTSEVMQLVDDTTSFETALVEYKKNNPQYFGDIVVKKTQTSPALNGGTKPQTTNDIMNDLLRNRGK